MDQILTYILSAVGILGFFLAGRKVWWAWYVNIANQVLWTVFSVTTQQWGFLLATGFYFVVFSINAYKWTKEYLAKKNEPITIYDVEEDPETGEEVYYHNGVPVEPNFKAVPAKTMGMRWGYMKPPREVRSADDIPEPPGAHFKVDEETTASYMRSEGTDPAVSNDIAHVVSDVMRAQTGGYIHPTFTIRYGIAHEVQRRLDVKLKGTRPDEKVQIRAAIYQIDKAMIEPLDYENADARTIQRMQFSLAHSRAIFEARLRDAS